MGANTEILWKHPTSFFSERQERGQKRPQEETHTHTQNSDHLIFSLCGGLCLDARCPPSPSNTPLLMKWGEKMKEENPLVSRERQFNKAKAKSAHRSKGKQKT